jgi:crotonobetaine/carnitine-CoA ligase
VTAGTLGELYRAAEREAPTVDFVRMAACRLTYEEAARWSAAIAGGLQQLGVGPGDRVVVSSRNRPEMIVTWLACLRLGACFAPVNPETATVHLPSLLTALAPGVIVTERERRDDLGAAAHGAGLDPVVVELSAGPTTGTWAALETAEPFDDWAPADAADRAAIICTSGTTGPSKGVALSHRWFTKICETSADHWTFSADDRFYCPFPLYHMDALALTVAPAIYHRTTAAIGERFSVSRFWDEIRELDATVFDFLGSTLTMLWKQPARDDDRDHPARLGWGVPLPPFRAEFEDRFGCQLVDGYGSTDVGIPVYSRPDEVKPDGACGRAVEGYEVAILDARGERARTNEIGEIAVRTSEPHIILEEYVGRPDATLEAWRGLWHHTGDLGRMDEQGYLYFEGRATDTIRRRGENISAQELEAIVLTHDAVLDVAAIGVPSELTEEDVKVVATARAGEVLAAPDLAAWLADTVPRFMTVRYVEVLDRLPLTATGKIAKYQLRERWRTTATWDRETDGFLPVTQEVPT